MSNKAVANKIIEAWKHIGSIPKNGRNSKFSYSFVREEDAADALRNAFIKVGLSCVPSVEKLERSVIKTNSGSEMQHVIVTMKFTLTDKDTGETDSFVMVGEAADSFDKAVYKAITGCTKYAYVKLAMSGAEDNEDEDTGPEKQEQTTSTAKPIQQGTTYRKPEETAKSAQRPAAATSQPADSVKPPAAQPTSAAATGQPKQDKPNTSSAGNTSTAASAEEKLPSEVPIFEDEGYITAVIPAMKGKPAVISFKSESNGGVLAISFDPKTVDVPSLLKLQSGKSKVQVRCDVTSGQPHLMMIKGV